MSLIPFKLPASLEINVSLHDASRCFAYAVQETCRLLERLGVHTRLMPSDGSGDGTFWMMLMKPGETREQMPASVLPQKADGYRLRIATGSVSIAARSTKGVLNGVYDLAERLGFLFLLPGETGEWTPNVTREAICLPVDDTVVNPRFDHRGVFLVPMTTDCSLEEWLRFYAKLRFNAVAIGDVKYADYRSLAEELGLRLELGQHGFHEFVPRDLFDKNPDLFRMFQPEDFGGKRCSDSNCCITHPRTKQLIQKNYRKLLKDVPSVYALHCWPDDLPAGGWCLCPSCRALTPSDQAMLAMRHLAEAAAQATPPVRVPALAYHDTMFPGSMIMPSKECFLLFAPRERCYGHALDDDTCARNRHYRQALEAWTRRFEGIDDAHTFEYYFDQILFRGLYPFLPTIILEDMRVYESHGIATHLSLQVAGPAVAPEFNMLVFAQGLWDRSLTAAEFIEGVACKILPQNPEAWRVYLRRRAEIFTAAMQMCDHELGIYLDYRWLPENTGEFGPKMARIYAESAAQLAQAIQTLTEAVRAEWPERARRLVVQEAARARFEAAELQVMTHQQTAMNALGYYHDTGDRSYLQRAVDSMKQTIAKLRDARTQALAAGIGEKEWYFSNINRWLTREVEAKVERFVGKTGKPNPQ